MCRNNEKTSQALRATSKNRLGCLDASDRWPEEAIQIHLEPQQQLGCGLQECFSSAKLCEEADPSSPSPEWHTPGQEEGDWVYNSSRGSTPRGLGGRDMEPLGGRERGVDQESKELLDCQAQGAKESGATKEVWTYPKIEGR